MTGEEYLKSLRTACNELKVLNEELYSIKSKTQNTGSQAISERVLSSSTNASMKTVDFVLDLENEIKAKTEIFVAKRTQANELIKQIDNINFRLVLIERYLLCKDWKDISKNLNYSKRQMYRIHNLALDEFEKIF